MKRVSILIAFLFAAPLHGQQVFDCMNYANKPELGARRDLSLSYEYALTLRDEAPPASSFTIEPASVRKEGFRLRGAKFIAIDIESLGSWENDHIRAQYLDLMKRSAFESQVGWWNLGPGSAPNLLVEAYKRDWKGSWQLRQPLIEQVDFIILGMYFTGGEPFDSWHKRNIPRIQEAKRLSRGKPVFVVLCPNIPRPAGIKWPFQNGDYLRQAVDAVVVEADALVWWYVETPVQGWSDSIAALTVVRSTIGADGMYNSIFDAPGN